ncbi:MAG: chorismate mutase [Methanomicrobiales archaeon]|nr:chorismate mutase [Methanomicrobiales archaeon]
MSVQIIRQKINQIDQKIIGLIAERQKRAGELALLKHREGLPIRDENRRKEVLELVFNLAVEQRIDPVYAQKIYEILIDMSEERQRECSGEGNLP